MGRGNNDVIINYARNEVRIEGNLSIICLCEASLKCQILNYHQDLMSFISWLIRKAKRFPLTEMNLARNAKGKCRKHDSKTVFYIGM